MDLAIPVPLLTDLSQFLDPNIIGQFEAIIKKIIENDNCETALLGCEFLEKNILPELLKQSGELEIVERYRNMVYILKFMNLSVYGLTQIQELVKDHLLVALNAGVPIKDKFQRVLDIYDDFLLEGQIAETLANAMLSCKEKIGDFPLLTKDGKSTIPSAGDWLKQYLEFSVSSSEHKTGTLERIQFIKTEKNAQKLQGSEQDVLLHIFRLYDWLRFGDIEDTEESNQTNGYSNSQKFYLPAEVLEQPQAQKPIAPPIVPAPPVTKKPVPMDDVGITKTIGPDKSARTNTLSGLSDRPSPPEGEKNNVLRAIPPVKLPVLKPLDGYKSAGGGRSIQDILSNRSNESSFAKASADKAGSRNLEQDGAGLKLGGEQVESRKSKVESQKARGQALSNQKPAEAGLVDSSLALEPGLSSDNRIPQGQKVVKRQFFSGGGEGNRTPRALDDNPGSAPSHPHSDELYHKQGENKKIGDNGGRPINVEEIKKQTIREVLNKQKQIDLKLASLEKRVEKRNDKN